MAGKRKEVIREEDLKGFKHFKLLKKVLAPLHRAACARDRASNRTLHLDQYCALILLYFFNPIVTNLRGIQQASELKKVQRKLGCARASLGSLSESARVFDAAGVRSVVEALSNQLPVSNPDARLSDFNKIITLVDGTVLPLLPELVKAMWQEAGGAHGVKLHTHFELLKGVPARMDLTDGDASERAALQASLRPDRIYVIDRGYAKFELFADILEVKSSFVCRVRDNSVFEILQDKPVSAAAQAAHVRRDWIIRFGDRAARAGLVAPLRLVQIACTPRRKAYKIGRGGPEQGDTLLVVTDIMDADAELIALLYKRRWVIETFFRFFKHVLGCRHLLSHCANGIEIQVYLAIIACMLIALWTGRKPTLRTYEMLCHYMSGLADEEELLGHIEKLRMQH